MRIMTRFVCGEVVLGRKDTDGAGVNPQKPRTSRLEEFSWRKNVLWHSGADGIHRLVHDLAQPQIHRHAAKKIRVNIGEAPAGDQQVNHPRGGRAGGGDGIVSRLDHDPSLGRLNFLMGG